MTTKKKAKGAPAKAPKTKKAKPTVSSLQKELADAKALKKVVDTNRLELEKQASAFEKESDRLYDEIDDLQYKVDNAKALEACLKRWATRMVPETGAFKCYKQAFADVGCENVVVTLEVPAKAKRTSPVESTDHCGEVGKSRVSEALVLAIVGIETGNKYEEAKSHHDSSFAYKVGETIKPDSYSGRKDVTCTNGIHVFMKRADAVNY